MAAAAADALRNADVRAWARENGWEISDAGRMPAGVLAAYDAAHASDDDNGPDWNAAAQALGVQPGVDPLADDAGADDLDGGAAAQPAAPAAQPDDSGPPVTSLADARARLNAQPKRPPWAREGGKDGKPASGRKPRTPKPPPLPPGPAPIEVTPAVLDDMAGKMALLLGPAIFAWGAIDDDDCADIAADHMGNIIDKMVPVLARSQAVVRFMTIDAAWFALVALAQAVQPVALAVYRNHFTREAREARSPEARQARAAQQQAQADLSGYVVNPVVSGHVPAYRPA